MMLQLRSMLGNIICWKSIAETCGLLQHIRFKRSSMLLLRTQQACRTSFQFLSCSKHSNGSTIRAMSSHSKPICQNNPVSFRLLLSFIPGIARFDSDLFSLLQQT